MVLLNSLKHFNRFLGPFLLRNGVRLRKRFLDEGADRPYLDAAIGITMGQWLTGLEARDQANDLIEGRQQSNGTSTKTSSYPPSLSLDQEAAIRVKVLEDYVRPALVPNESWGSDVATYWQFYPRLVRWLRQEYLGARFGPHVQAARNAYPALAQSPQFSIHIPPTYQNLPKSSLVQASLCIASHDDKKAVTQNKMTTTSWASTKDRNAVVKSMQSISARYGGKTQVVRGGALCWNELPENASTKNMPLSDILQLVGANVHLCGPLNTWLEQRRQFQFWTREYIAKLGDYLLQRCEGQSNMTILEVGAGDGLLTALLQDYVQNHAKMGEKRRHPKRAGKGIKKSAAMKDPLVELPKFVATDNGSWSIRKKATVMKMDYQQALETCAMEGDGTPLIVLCSWMPMSDDWTAAFRKNSAVVEYILIGEADDGQCGEHWETWGNPHFREPHNHESFTETAPYEKDGFKRQELVSLLPFQFSRYDSALSKEGTTVSFRRKS
eukprot:scaffold2276_cov160-Amphora_coffeaeformis.AAC.16